MVTVNMQVDIHEIAEQAKAGIAELSHAAVVFTDAMDKLGVQVAVIISVVRDPR